MTNNNKLIKNIIPLAIGLFVYLKFSLITNIILFPVVIIKYIISLCLSPLFFIKMGITGFVTGFINSIMSILFSIKGLVLLPLILLGGGQFIPYALCGYLAYYTINYKNNHATHNTCQKNDSKNKPNNCFKQIQDECHANNNKIKQLLDDFNKVFYRDKNNELTMHNDFLDCRDMKFGNTTHKDIKCDTIFSKNMVSYSDRTLKKNIKNIKPETALDKIKQLQGVYYHWNNQDSEQNPNVGFIAQEVKKIIPELVNHDKENDKLAVEYDKLAALLVEAIKELSCDKKKK